MKIIIRLLGLSLLMLITWILGIEVANSILGVKMPTADADPGKALGLMFLVCLINSALLLALLFCSQLLIPNPFMPGKVAIMHF